MDDGKEIGARRLTLILLFAFAATALPLLVTPRDNSDLLALWLAAEAWAHGAPIYADPGAFTMRPPAGWAADAAALGHDGIVYPYLYPPLWAALLAPVTQALTFPAFAALASALNPALLLLTSHLAWCATDRKLPLLPFLLAGQTFFAGTLIGGIALLQNQPQILVAALTVAAIERNRAGAPATAGAALALAASIKLYPAIFVVLWLAAREWRPAAAFAVSGAALAALSVALAGWPLHLAFLDMLRDLTGTVISNRLTFSLDSVALDLVPPAGLSEIEGVRATGGPAPSWAAYAKPAAWTLASRAALLAVLALAGLAAARAGPRRRAAAIWPAAMIAALLVSPLGWGYYYIAPVAFAPALLAPATPRRLLALAAIFAPISLPAFLALDRAPAIAAHVSALGVAAMAALAGFLLASGGARFRRDSDLPLHRRRACL